MKRTSKILLFTFYFLLLLGVTSKLFLEEYFDRAVSFLTPFRAQENAELTIGFSEPAIRLDPLANDTGSRSRLFHIYEALVSANADLQIKPALAISYGSLDNFTWEFRLRPGVMFHNGEPLAIEDVFYSIEQAQKNPDSGVKDLASSISELKKIDDQIFRIVTHAPDPLLLQKLSQILIFSSWGSDSPPFLSQHSLGNPRDPSSCCPMPIGTGPYAFEKNENGILTLRRFAHYWDKKPAFETARLKTFSSKEEKLAALKNRDVDIVANVPPDAARRFQFPGFSLKTRPSLEVNFLMFHFDKTFRDRRFREAVKSALSVADLSKLTRGFSVPAGQFVGNGIFGYDPEITLQTPSPKHVGEAVSVTLDLPEGLEIFGASVQNQLKKIGMNVELAYLKTSELGRKIQNRESEFFFFGWRSDLGDASDFLTAAVHSPAGNFGQFNGGNYRNAEADRLIEMSQKTVEQETRLEILRAVMKKITVEDIIGVPLFSPEILYGVSENVKFTPRVDGYVLAQEVKV